MSYPAMNFDTHRDIKVLVQQGFKEEQAESIIGIIYKNREHDLSNLATKQDLKLLENKLEAIEQKFESKFQAIEQKFDSKIENVEERLERKITDAKYEILKWTIPLLITNTLAIIGIAITIMFKIF